VRSLLSSFAFRKQALTNGQRYSNSKVILTTFIQSPALRDTAVVVQHKIPLTLQPIGDGKMELPLYAMLELANSFYFCLLLGMTTATTVIPIYFIPKPCPHMSIEWAPWPFTCIRQIECV
jgi:hypothetical protein